MPSFSRINVSINGLAWEKVDTFEHHGPDDQVYTLDPATCTVSFGDGKRGRRPPPGSTIAVTYRTGGGSTGNNLSVTWEASDPHSHSASSAIVIALPDPFRISFYQGIGQSWRWRSIIWLCDVLKVNYKTLS